MTHFYSAPQCSHCKRCTGYGNSVRLSVTRQHCVKTTARSTVQFALSDSKICLVLQTPKKYSPGTTPSPEILAPSDLPPPEGSEFWHICFVAPQPQVIEKEVQLLITRTRHRLSRLYAAPNLFKMGINYLNLSSFGQFRQ